MDAAHAARTPRLHALAHPDFLLLQAAIEVFPGQLLGVQEFLFAHQEGVVIAFPIAQMPAVQLHHPVGQTAQEGPVMGDKEKGPAGAQQVVLQPGDGFQIQMVGGLVEQHQVGLAHQRLGQQYATARPARQRFKVGLRIQLQARDHLVGVQRARAVHHLVLLRSHDVDDPALQVGGHLLGEPAHPEAGRRDDLPVVRFGFASQDAHHGALAGAVGAEQADAVSALDVELHLVQQGESTETQGNVFQA